MLIAKRDNSANSLYELFEEFQVLYSVKAEISTLENVYKQIEKNQQQEIIIDRILDNKSNNPEETETILENSKKVGSKIKTDYLNCTKSFSEYQKKYSSDKTEYKSDDIEAMTIAMTIAMTKMTEALILNKIDKTNSLEKLFVPVWDGKQKSYLIWKHEFKYWMEKYKQDNEEQLQRIRKALPKHSFLADQVK